MREEYFDVVNDADQVIDRLPRSRVHREGLKHRAVHILVFHTDGRLFLQKRSMSKDSEPGKWDSSAAGHLDSGESYDQAAHRELKEELGVAAIKPLEKILRIDACQETGMEFLWVYKTAHPGPFQLHPEEIEQGGWFDLQAIDQWTNSAPEHFAGGFLKIWSQLQDGCLQ